MDVKDKENKIFLGTVPQKEEITIKENESKQRIPKKYAQQRETTENKIQIITKKNQISNMKYHK